MVRPDSSLQPDRYEREDSGRLHWFYCISPEVRRVHGVLTRFFSGAKLVRCANARCGESCPLTRL